MEVAKQIKDNISHNKGLDALDKDFEIVLGKAKAGVDTEANYNNVDKIIEKIQKSSVGKLFGNEVAISLGVAAIYGVAIKGSVSAAQKTVKWIAPVVGMAASAGIGGAVAGLRENKRIKDERAQHGREMAKGGKNIEQGSENREEMEESRYETKDAMELAGSLQKALEALKNQPDEKKFSEVLDKYNEIGFRAAVASRDKIDLISFSDAKKVEEERTKMYKICGETKKYLEENAGKKLANFCRDNKELEDKIKQGRLTKIENFEKEKEIKDEIFNKLKREKVRAAVAKGVLIGLGAGVVMQEVGAATGISGGSKEGIFNSASDHATDKVHHYTFVEGLRRYISGDTPKMPSTNGNEVMQEHIVETKKYVENNKELFSSIKRGGWADNDTIKPDKNELRMHWGGEKGSGVDANGNYVFNIKHMTHGGSFHGGKHWDPQELMKEGKIRMLISLSKDTQNQVVEIPFDANGNAIIDPNSEIGRLAFENIDGHAKFIGKFAEVAVMGENKDGIDTVNTLATLKGDGIEGVSYIIPEPKPEDIPVDYEIDTPYVIPIVPHNPLEKLKEKKKGDDEIKYKKTFSSAIKIEKETDPVRAAAMHTIYNFENSAGKTTYAEAFGANDKDWKEREEKFAKLSRKFWTELTVHGFSKFNSTTGKWEVKKTTDQDAYGCLKLMELAGIEVNMSKVNFVEQGTFSDSGITMDTSKEQHGVAAEEGGRRLIIDHHGKESGRDSSATKFVYEILVGMGLLDKKPHLDKYVEFITKQDNLNFTENEMKQVYSNYSKNLYGLSYRMKTQDILELFEKNVDPMKDLPDDYLKTHTYVNPQNGKEEPLSQLVEHMEKQIKNGERSLKILEKAGFAIDTGNKRFGKILIDTKKKNGKGNWFNKIDGENHSDQMAVFLNGYGGYLVWSPQENSFVLYTKNKIDEKSVPGGFSQGFNMRGNMWMKSLKDPEKLTITLEEILAKLKGQDLKDFKLEGKLKEALDTDAKIKELVILLDNNKLDEAALRKAAKNINISPAIKLMIELLGQKNGLKKKYSEGVDKLTKKTVSERERVAIEILLEYQKKKNGNGKTTIAKQSQAAPSATTPSSTPVTPSRKPKTPKTASQSSPAMPQQPAQQLPQMPGNMPDQKQEKIANSVNKLAGSFSNFELSYDAIKEEAKNGQIETHELAVGFIENDPELKSQYEAEIGSIDKNDNKAVEKLAMTIILKDEEKKMNEQIKEKEKEIVAVTNDQEKKKLENEKNELETKVAFIVADLHILNRY